MVTAPTCSSARRKPTNTRRRTRRYPQDRGCGNKFPAVSIGNGVTDPSGFHPFAIPEPSSQGQALTRRLTGQSHHARDIRRARAAERARRGRWALQARRPEPRHLLCVVTQVRIVGDVRKMSKSSACPPGRQSPGSVLPHRLQVRADVDRLAQADHDLPSGFFFELTARPPDRGVNFWCRPCRRRCVS
jgi:hypothetical protein